MLLGITILAGVACSNKSTTTSDPVVEARKLFEAKDSTGTVVEKSSSSLSDKDRAWNEVTLNGLQEVMDGITPDGSLAAKKIAANATPAEKEVFAKLAKHGFTQYKLRGLPLTAPGSHAYYLSDTTMAALSKNLSALEIERLVALHILLYTDDGLLFGNILDKIKFSDYQVRYVSEGSKGTNREAVRLLINYERTLLLKAMNGADPKDSSAIKSIGDLKSNANLEEAIQFRYPLMEQATEKFLPIEENTLVKINILENVGEVRGVGPNF